jgi:hypothetical protein
LIAITSYLLIDGGAEGEGERRGGVCELKRELCCRYSSAKSFFFGMIATFFPVFDVPVFWPILLLYFFVLFFITMKRQIKHMIKHKYIPFDLGKKVTSPPLSNTLSHMYPATTQTSCRLCGSISSVCPIDF